MTLSVPLSSDTEARLSAQAKAMGVDTSTYAAQILQAAANRAPLSKMLDTVRQNFAASGMTEEQAAERYEVEKHAARAAKHGTSLND